MLTQQADLPIDYSASVEAVELIPEFTVNGRAYALKSPVVCAVSNEEGVIIWCELYLAYGHGATFEEAKSDLFGSFATIYRGIALEEDTKLSPGAQMLKRQLLEEVSDGSIQR